MSYEFTGRNWKCKLRIHDFRIITLPDIDILRCSRCAIKKGTESDKEDEEP